MANLAPMRLTTAKIMDQKKTNGSVINAMIIKLYFSIQQLACAPNVINLILDVLNVATSKENQSALNVPEAQCFSTLWIHVFLNSKIVLLLR